MTTLRQELESARIELALACGEINMISDLAQGRINRTLKLVGILSDSLAHKTTVDRPGSMLVRRARRRRRLNLRRMAKHGR